MSEVFKQYRIEDLDNATTDLIKRTVSLVEFTQNVLFAMAERLESEKSAIHLTKFITDLSEWTGKGDQRKLVLSATARQVGVYMKAMLPIKWKDNAFVFSEGLEDFDWEKARKAMEATRWDKYKAMKADDAFNAESVWKIAMAKLNEIVKHTDDLPEDQQVYARRALHMLNSVGEFKA